MVESSNKLKSEVIKAIFFKLSCIESHHCCNQPNYEFSELLDPKIYCILFCFIIKPHNSRSLLAVFVLC